MDTSSAGFDAMLAGRHLSGTVGARRVEYGLRRVGAGENTGARRAAHADHSAFRRSINLAAIALGVCFLGLGASGCHSGNDPGLPATLTAGEFWRLSTSLSEPPGTFEHSANLVSNEIRFVHMARVLHAAGGVYIGVGPEQNFSYIARLRPEMAFIVDIRQENRNLHLLYKGLFELSSDRAEFLSRLFSRERPGGIGPDATVHDLFAAFQGARPEKQLFDTNVRAVRDRLVAAHELPLTANDLDWIRSAQGAFFADGPAIHYGRVGADESPGPSYADLMTATDMFGESRSYLASEEGFAFLKQLHAKNLIVPVVGDFAGPHSLRLTGDYIRERGAVVRVFYGSNVEVYLNRPRRASFCSSLAALPRDSAGWFIGSKDMRRFADKLKSCPGSSR